MAMPLGLRDFDVNSHRISLCIRAENLRFSFGNAGDAEYMTQAGPHTCRAFPATCKVPGKTIPVAFSVKESPPPRSLMDDKRFMAPAVSGNENECM